MCKAFYTVGEVSEMLGLPSKTIIRYCEIGKFHDARQSDGGRWKIPADNFIVSKKQANRVESVLKRIDQINRNAGDVNEYDL